MRRALVLLLILALMTSAAAGVDVSSWAVSDGKDSLQISGSVEDFQKIAEIRRTVRGPFIYARSGRDAWLITDAATVTVAKALCREPAHLEARRRQVEREVRELELEMRSIERRLDDIDRLKDEGRDDASLDAEEQRLEERERMLEEREGKIDALQDAVEEELDAWWDEKVEREVGRLIARAIENGHATGVQR